MLLNHLFSLLAGQFTSPGPIAFEIGQLAVRWYGLLIALAVLMGTYLAQHLAKLRQVNPDLIADLAIWLVLGAIPGARIYYVIFQWSDYVTHPSDIIAIWKGGIAIHGAIIGGLMATVIFAKVKKISFWQLADLIAPSLILGQAIGRWGNFFNSEAFGLPTNLPWKLYIPPENRSFLMPEYASESYFHPTFLYESLWNLLVFALLIKLFSLDRTGKSSLKIGTLFLVYMVAYSAGRLWIEGLRMDSLMLGPLKMAQVISLVAISVGAMGLIWLYQFDRSLPDVTPSDQL